MNLDDTIEMLKMKVQQFKRQEDKQLLHWLLELRTLRNQIHGIQRENELLKQEYEKLLLQNE